MAATSTSRTYDETLDDIETTLGLVPGFLEQLPDSDLVNEWPAFKRHTVEETAIPGKYKELMGLAIAANLKCPYCQYFHTEAAKLHGATEEELAETFYLASFTSRYSAMIHAQHYDYTTFEDETDRIGEHLQAQMAAADD